MSLSNTATPKYYGEFRDSVIRGEIPVNEEVSMQMNRIDELIANPYYFYDDDAINGYVSFCENELTLTDGSPLVLLPSFKLWAEDLFAWFYFAEEKVYDPVRKRFEIKRIKYRLRKKQYLIVARGAAKSMYAASVQAYGLIVDTATTQQAVIAPTMKQAEETMQPIRTAIARARGPLFEFLTEGDIRSNTYTKKKLASTKKGVENFLTNSYVEIRPMFIDRLQGMHTKYNSIDEWLSGEVKEDVIGAVEQGASKIKDYIILATSSEGTARDGVGDTIKMELMDILRGDYKADQVSIWHYKLDNVSEVNQPEMWLKANPNIGVSVSYSTYQADVERAEAQPSQRNDILAKRFGIPMAGYSYFFTYEETVPHATQNYDGMLCAMGMDASQGDDFWAFDFLFPLGNGRFGVKTKSYVSSVKVSELPQATKNKYYEFVNEGSLIIMEGTTLDSDAVYEDLDAYIIKHRFEIGAFGYDPYNAEPFVKRWTAEYGAFGVEKVRQGVITESVPLGELKHMAHERMLVFDERLMTFSMQNSIVVEDSNGNRKLSKKRRSEKIDNVSACMDAWVAYKRNKEAFAQWE